MITKKKQRAGDGGGADSQSDGENINISSGNSGRKLVLCALLCYSVCIALVPFWSITNKHANVADAAISQPVPASQPTQAIEIQINMLKKRAYSVSDKSEEFVNAWQQILNLQPSNLEAHVMLGWALLPKNPPYQDLGITLLEDAFDASKVSPTIDHKFPQTYMIAATIGRYRSQKKEYADSQKFTKLALQLGPTHEGTTKSEITCMLLQLATMFDYFPASVEDADSSIDSLLYYQEKLLTGWTSDYWPIDDKDMAQFPGAAPDVINHCVLSLFSLSFYYRADVAMIAKNHYEMSRKGWPALDYTSDFVKRYDVISMMGDQPCVDRKIRLAVISAVITEGHSNSESFGGVLSRLDRNLFDVTYILLTETVYAHQSIASFTKAHHSDKVYIWAKEERDAANGSTWLTRWGKEIGEMELDIIFYTDLTMSNLARRLGMMRLAPIQINSHGHPMTSGHPQTIIQYFLSWEAAEQNLEEAQKHYTEELKLLPSDVMFQYYERRILPTDISRLDGQSFSHLRRSDFGLPEQTRLYLCMQKPFKLSPEFDKLVCGITVKDSEGYVVLHRADTISNQKVFMERLTREGCDLSRVIFLEQQPHHKLLALYRAATVVLDSHPAGGDTTTREIIEMGKALVTLPGRLLGGRWTLGYFNHIGLKEATKKALIATNPVEYVDLAITLARDDNLRQYVEADIRKCAPNLFEQHDSVTAWQNMLLEISPYQQCRYEGMQAGEL